ncbi:MAG: UbiX family flavin prenyltransferase [Chloroflexi bacterium]|nr:UbiX family flavin prenyltransferase [Chloroflexota bacterium]
MRRLVVGISGASGAIYGIRLLQALAATPGVETHLVLSRPAEITVAVETDFTPAQVRALAHAVYEPEDLAAPIASGSFPVQAMLVAPCSAGTLARVATSAGDNLLTRAADVTLKERRPLILLFRETPLTLAHIRNMEAVTLMGGIVMPPLPAFYSRPQTVADLVDGAVGRALDLLGIDHRLGARWQGRAERP